MKDSLKPFVEKCPALCGADVLVYHPSRRNLTAKWPKAEILECEPTPGGTWTATPIPASDEKLHIIAGGHRLTAVKLTPGQLVGAKRNGVDLHEPHANYCANGGRKPRK